MRRLRVVHTRRSRLVQYSPVNDNAVREMRIAILELSINLTTGELLDIERVTSSSERGGWKRAEHFSTSLVAYSTSCPVLKQRGEKGFSLRL